MQCDRRANLRLLHQASAYKSQRLAARYSHLGRVARHGSAAGSHVINVTSQATVRSTRNLTFAVHTGQYNIGAHLNLHLSLTPLISLLAGILILVMPKLLNFIVAIYLIVVGLLGLFGAGAMRLN